MAERPKGYGMTAEVSAKMASRPKGYGYSAEIADKISSKYDVDKAKEAIDWLSDLIQEPVDNDDVSPEGFAAILHDGTILVKAMNIIYTEKDGRAKYKVNTSKMAFKMMENIGNFLDGCGTLGMQKGDLFETSALYESTNLPQVVSTIHALGRKVQTLGISAPALGPKESQKNTREFTEDQKTAGKNIIGLQAGSNKGASQSGMTFGQQRQIHK